MLFLDYIPDLSPLEYDLYRYVAKNLSEIYHLKLKDLAEKTHSSTASISRFCKKFECDSYSESK
jgi:DNA-binding MurR/RpiR family transcriptional regulator